MGVGGGGGSGWVVVLVAGGIVLGEAFGLLVWVVVV